VVAAWCPDDTGWLLVLPVSTAEEDGQSARNTLNVWEKFRGSFSEAVVLYYTLEQENSCSSHALRMDHSILLPNNRGE